MASITTTRRRNIGIMAHIDAGKTTTTERILYYTGRTWRMGEVHEGTATMDFDPREQERGITIMAAATTCQWRPVWALDEAPYQINIIDTPGHVDFTVEVERSLRVLDGAVALFCGVHGVEPQSEAVWRQADRYAVPRIAFVNKMDRPGADLGRVLEMIRARLGIEPLAVQLPWLEGEELVGVVDLVERVGLRFDADSLGASWTVEPVPESLEVEAEVAREELVDALTREDEGLMEAWMEQDGEVGAAAVRAALRRVTLRLRGVPVLCGASFRNIGVQPLLDAVVAYLPSPADLPPVRGVRPERLHALEEARAALREDALEELRPPQADAPLAALAFKVMSDEEEGGLTFLRVYSGALEAGAEVLNAGRGVREVIGRLVRMHANTREPVERLEAGDIGAAVGLVATRTGDTLCAPEAPLVLASIHVPEPVIQMRIEPATEEEQARLDDALASLALEDPSFRVSVHPETGQTLLAGMGELHLEIIHHRLVHDFRVACRAGAPEVAYRETPTREARQEERFVRQAGDQELFAQVILRLTPGERGSGLRFEVAPAAAAALEASYLQAAELGVRESAEVGPLGGWPLVDAAVVLEEAEANASSSARAFKNAASLAMREVMKGAALIVLEPIMEVEVLVPEEFVGTVLGDLGSRRGEVQSFEARAGGLHSVSARVPLASMFGYAAEVRSRTQGRATYTMRFASYGPAPRGAG